MEKLRDHDVREILLEKLTSIHEHEQDTRIINELAVCGGLSRVDVAVVNGVLHGYEIKSESDTLYRLQSQMTEYNKVFERVTIVAAEDFLPKLRETVPPWWGIMVVKNRKGKILLNSVKKGRKNPSIEADSLVQLLWRQEALELLKKRGLEKGFLSKPKAAIYDQLVKEIPLRELVNEVNDVLKYREGWREQ
ncbi:hypothetical protein J31TS6_22620 [Brevibacillus reuszeri]|uniref:sce7726 family protein n=1 Tax=Brevibacillus reuszeri TaxID=54915 RepID=UPI001B0AC799|nr:sce7726 family protein [Brevibacillus reuszeri]GIO06234.1 hypothetical protein J31TS6_22620 [Brevibacillus reuszeri]